MVCHGIGRQELPVSQAPSPFSVLWLVLGIQEVVGRNTRATGNVERQVAGARHRESK